MISPSPIEAPMTLFVKLHHVLRHYPQPHWRRLIHRADRCDLSLFQLGLRLLDFWLEDDAPLRVAFLPQATQANTLVFKSVR
jgi:hypothetical protein